jgi:Ca2+-binding RTX toxin-like protein
MRRILLLMSMALMFAAAVALSGVAQAKPIANGKADAKCLAEAIRTLGPDFNPSGYHFVGGTAGDDFFYRAATAGPDVFCGFGGNDSISTLEAGDIFLGGAGLDTVDTNNGTFNGGAGDDYVENNSGTFNGGDNNDIAYSNYDSGTFNGGAGDDYVKNNSGTFDGGDGTDTAFGNDGILISVEQGDV